MQSRRIQCFLCLQPSHDCEAITQAIQAIELSPHQTKGRVWICSGCYDKNNPLASNRRNRSNGVAFENITTPLNTPRASPAPSSPSPETASNIDPPAEDDLGDQSNPTPPNTSPDGNLQDPEICQRYAKNQCPHGMGGQKEINGQKCRYSHPRRCKRFCMFGSRGRGGCNKGNDCTFYHPKLCNNSLKDSACYNENCTFVHTKGTKRRQNARDHSPQGHYRHEHSSRDYHPRSRFTSQSRAENPRRESRSRSGHPNQPTDLHRSRPQTPANYLPRPNDRSPIPAAAPNNNNSEVSFLLRMLQNMKNDFQRDLSEIRQSIQHQQPQRIPPTSQAPPPTQRIPPQTHSDNPTVPSLHQLNPSAPLWMQNIPQFYC